MSTEISRPLFHLTPRRNWMNDPNGLVHDGALWHAFFQYNPHGPDWGNMSWGHATSTDLQHWEEHPVALSHSDGEQIYSGSVVAPSTEEPLVAFYTSAYSTGMQALSRAVSHDGGFSWVADPDNPVIDRGSTDFRDPKVIRYHGDDGDSRWILLAVEAVERRVLFFESRDLRTWAEVGSFGPIGPEGVVWECPDLLRLHVDGAPDDARWVLLLSTNAVGDHADPDGSSMHYLVGDFDGRAFTTDASELTRLDHGRDLYAGVTFDNAPDDRVIMLGWMSNWRYAHVVPSAPWRGAMSLPRTLSLRSIGPEVLLVQEPAYFMRAGLAGIEPIEITEASNRLALSGHSLVDLRWEPRLTGVLRIRMQGDADATVELTHDPRAGTLVLNRLGPASEAVHPDFAGASAAPLRQPWVGRLLLSLDGPLLEVFAGDGATTMSSLVVLGSGRIQVDVCSEHPGPLAVRSVDIEADESGAVTAAPAAARA
ncbi:beta-fructosidase levanase/invertase [Agromyces rhizosphaerae]|uniref:Beta-fructosidase levanase/invertase n=1 Tax=Agromyces rhizosphaerae TaxID=88374 RepID=A0A9W6FQZ5_9MICO|nr:glycoside hydrolase family 32 protein [Agromyces rhizosphaerae]GLI27137.1 beta-fructosidase levanase/invertase [Agromyces rhizosphaerae]